METKLNLEAIEAAEKAATPGPWEAVTFESESADAGIYIKPTSEGAFSLSYDAKVLAAPIDSYELEELTDCADEDGLDALDSGDRVALQSDANMRLVCLLRNNAKALIARVRELEAEVERWKSQAYRSANQLAEYEKMHASLMDKQNSAWGAELANRDRQIAVAREALCLAPSGDEYRLMALCMSATGLPQEFQDHISRYDAALKKALAALSGGEEGR